jgi:Na+-transporting methylmalonyl-CoA/oxaloacetate decarboxylase gamma subunit
MTLLEGLQILVIGLGTVFLVLVSLSGAVALESKIFGLFGKSKKVEPADEAATNFGRSTSCKGCIRRIKTDRCR